MIAVMMVVVMGGVAMGGLIQVGSGGSFANVTVNWSDGYVAEFKILFETSTISGFDAMNQIDSAISNFDLTISDYGWGAFIDGISYAGHSNIGYSGGENWWRYWIKNGDSSSWGTSGIGASGRVLSNGDSDGWVYGNAGYPIPEPATLLLLAFGAGWLSRKKA
jgi:hypothetical protein